MEFPDTGVPTMFFAGSSENFVQALSRENASGSDDEANAAKTQPS
jgi:hypothetical protein